MTIELDVTGIPKTLGEVLAAIERHPTLEARLIREVASAIRSLGVYLDKPLELLPAAPEALRRHMQTLNYRRAGVSQARLANVRSLLNKALQATGVKPTNRPVAERLSPGWKRLAALVDGRYERSSQLPFFRYCSESRIEPHEVNDGIADEYLRHLEATALVKKPRTTHQTFCRAWNRACKTIPAWPRNLLSVPRYARHYSLQLDEFLQTFQDELDGYLLKLGQEDSNNWLDEFAPAKPLRASSIRTKGYQIRAFASALVRKGIPIETISSLSVLVAYNNFKLGLSYFLDRPRREKDRPRTAGQIAHTICSVAKFHCKLPSDQLEKLTAIVTRLSHREPGMTTKNYQRLAPFNDPDVLRRFLELPLVETDRLRRGGIKTRNDAVRFANCVALEVLIHTGMRVGNLAKLALGDTIVMPERGKRGEASIHIPRSRVKNAQPLDFFLPADATELVSFYVGKVKPLLEPAPTSSLFPNKRGDCKRSDTVSKQISRLVADALGLEFNPHLMRHLIGKIMIDARPGDYEGPRRILAHRNSDTTYETYQGLETRSASRFLDDLIRSTRRYVPMGERPRAGRRLRSTTPATDRR
jgi:integrase